MKQHLAQREYWRSLEHLASSPEAMKFAEGEFAGYSPAELATLPPVTRRRFMQLMSASMALAGLTLTGCRRWPEKNLAPYTSNPRDRIPGVPEMYATMWDFAGVAIPLLITSYDGRPIKVDGNPSHPYSQTVAGKIGASDIISQSSILDLYDPQRATSVITHSGASSTASTFETFSAAFQPVIDGLASSGGDGFAILMQSTSSPSFMRLATALQQRYPKITWCKYEPISRENVAAGLKLACGTPVRPVLHLDKADVVVLIDADVLGTHPAHVKYANDWATRRRSVDDQRAMSRVYVAESAFSISGSIADHRLGLRPSRMGAILAAIAMAQGVSVTGADANLSADEKQFVDRVNADLSSHSGKAVVVAGSHLAPELHQLAIAINSRIGAIGNTLTLHQEPAVPAMASLSDLVSKIDGGGVKNLLILGGNPAYDAPADIDFASALKKTSAVHLSGYENETSVLCQWLVPEAHYLEAWSDGRAWDGTISVAQPLILPLWGGKTSGEMLAWIAGESEIASDAIVRKTFAGILTGGDFEKNYRKVIHDGLADGTAFAAFTGSITPPTAIPAAAAGDLEVRFMQHSAMYDGRFAPNSWLQEMPDPITKLVWDNAVLISKTDADKNSISNGDMVTITIGNRNLDIAACITAGQPIGTLGLPLGYGRTTAAEIGSLVGFNTYTLRTSDAMWAVPGAKIKATGETYELAMTQNHYLLDDVGLGGLQERVGKEARSNSELIREGTLDDYKKDSQIFKKEADGSLALQLYEPPSEFNTPHAWGMAIDMTTCIGCHACVAACQAENNIGVVGKDQVIKNRQMHWIRIDRYFKGDMDSPEVTYQPVTCQHCETAPCEEVCPVGATMHDTEGLNVMVYNRCVGTRYCSNNCPYKVRRFNYLDWQSKNPRHDKYPTPWLNLPDNQQLLSVPDIKRMVFNPEVSVRMRGVMEKCTFCIQRIHTTQINKNNAGEDLKDGDVVTACQEACPTQAIVFGDLNDSNSQVSQWHKSDRAYKLLGDLNTRPRNRFLAKVTNPVEGKSA